MGVPLVLSTQAFWRDSCIIDLFPILLLPWLLFDGLVVMVSLVLVKVRGNKSEVGNMC